ncbi:MAG TPA: glucose-6-phosphate isomerase [Candidatus Pelagibacter bacterium]|jgi:glucose-6-phosphate isomerase|nr:glucose-6-phosphate isomerase [Pelagibacteraceae bacterium]HJN83898.1 glucose-6-phosphate isomerase [Candidatus Pelagibacter bacterium]|tara:strand:- start:644 stop:1813 length:1170 start_codon:yes stop_codon:yes gene_type:complete
MLSKNIKFKNFLKKSKSFSVDRSFKILKNDYLKKKLKILLSLSHSYKYNYSKKIVYKYKNSQNYRVIGIGGSILGPKAIYQFLKHKIKKNFFFVDNLQATLDLHKKKKIVNLIISKSGNTLETISNSNILINNDKNIFIVENKNNYLNILANRLKADIIEHKNYIGGRYSVLSEVGMLPAELMGLNEKKFKRLNYLINDKQFIKNLVKNVDSTLSLVNSKKYISVILNYDHKSENLFSWYQQLIAESLGKKSKGIIPLVSTMPKDNHSLMQLYLDGPKNSFYTFFSVLEKNTIKINNKYLLKSHYYLRNKKLTKIITSQIRATKNIFNRKKIPFRSFEILERNEESLGEIFCFFILETILLGRALNVNPFDQPSVELIKEETKKILLRN